MGLEDVELILDIEKRYEVRFPQNLPWSRDVTVAQVASYVQALLTQKAKPCLTSSGFYALRQALVKVASVQRSVVHPRTLLEDVIPHKRRRRLWRRLRKFLLSRRLELAALEPSRRVRWIAAALSALYVAAIVMAFMASHYAATLAGVGLVLCALPVRWLLRLLHVEFPQGAQVVGDLSRAIHRLPTAEELAAAPTASDEVRGEIVRIIAKQLGIPPEQIRPDSRLYADLGMG